MTSEAIRVVVALAIVAGLLLVAGLLVSIVVSDLRSRESGARRQRPSLVPTLGQRTDERRTAFAPQAGAAVGPARPRERVFRTAGWAFLLGSALIAAASGLWPETLPAIVILVAVSGGFALVIFELLPAQVPAVLRGALEVLLAVGFATLLVTFTGGVASPFFFAFPLLVASAALVGGALVAFVVGLLAAAGYLLAAGATGGAPTATQLAALAVNLVGLVVLAAIAWAVGREQQRLRDAALRLSALDSLTGLFNRPFFLAALEREIARSNRSGRGFCLVMLDLDNLKEINDRYGHHAGDEVLRAVAETVRMGIRRVDVGCRYAGDEFVALLPETDPTGGWVVAEKIRLGVKDRAIVGYEVRPTVSVGVVSYPSDGRTADALMISADRAMYASKRGGGNRVASRTAEGARSPVGRGR